MAIFNSPVEDSKGLEGPRAYCQATGTGTWDLDLGLGTWDLGLGTWVLGLGTWDWDLGSGKVE